MTTTHSPDCVACRNAASYEERCPLGRLAIAGHFRQLATTAARAGHHQDAHDYRCIVDRMNKTLPLWLREHTDAYDPDVERVLLNCGFVDESWHNDVCARFTRNRDDGRTACIWVDHIDPAQREVTTSTRYSVCFYDADGNADDTDTLNTDDIAAALAYAAA